jgi:hypothetical protein
MLIGVRMMALCGLVDLILTCHYTCSWLACSSLGSIWLGVELRLARVWLRLTRGWPVIDLAWLVVGVCWLHLTWDRIVLTLGWLSLLILTRCWFVIACCWHGLDFGLTHVWLVIPPTRLYIFCYHPICSSLLMWALGCGCRLRWPPIRLMAEFAFRADRLKIVGFGWCIDLRRLARIRTSMHQPNPTILRRSARKANSAIRRMGGQRKRQPQPKAHINNEEQMGW